MILCRSTPVPRKVAILEPFAPILDWIDRELRETYSDSRGRGGNCLLELRQAFQNQSLNVASGSFYRLLPRLERTHFLLGYRIRQWFSIHLEVVASDPLERTGPMTFPIGREQRSLASVREQYFGKTAGLIAEGDIRVQVRAVGK